MDGLTNVCEATSQSLDFDNYRPTHRKGKKLLAEKKRRARINNCLMRIRDIVCHGADEKETDIDKMEKAEILERTLEVLTRVRHDFDSSRKMTTQTTQKAMAVKYASGFTSCAEESIRYIQNSRLVPAEVKHQLQNHLRSIAHRMESRIIEEEQTAYTHQYTPRTPPVVIAPPQVIPLSTPHLPSSSVPFMVDNGEGMVHLPYPNKNIDYHTINTRPSYIQPTPDIIMTTPQHMAILSQSEKKVHSIPSPIHSSTPITYIEDNVKRFSPVFTDTQSFITNPTTFIPVSDNKNDTNQHSHFQEHKENQPQNNTNIPQISSTSHNTSAFHKIVPRHCKSVSPTFDDNSYRQIRKHSSSSSVSPSTVFSSSQYSPISPVPSPVIVTTSTTQSPSSSLEHPQPIYSYLGYEPVPSHSHSSGNNSFLMPVAGNSPTEIQETPAKAMNLCVKQNNSHNISPETMWRPW